MELALGADEEIRFEVLAEDDSAQDSHLTHRPSVRTRRSSGGACSIDFLSRLNQVMEESQKLKVES